ncbi:MAG: hypothetical protein WCG99_01940 [Candidatus Berkelbacteria bacterium]
MWNPIAAIAAWNRRTAAMEHIERENQADGQLAWLAVIAVVSFFIWLMFFGGMEQLGHVPIP